MYQVINLMLCWNNNVMLISSEQVRIPWLFIGKRRVWYLYTCAVRFTVKITYLYILYVKVKGKFSLNLWLSFITSGWKTYSSWIFHDGLDENQFHALSSKNVACWDKSCHWNVVPSLILKQQCALSAHEIKEMIMTTLLRLKSSGCTPTVQLYPSKKHPESPCCFCPHENTLSFLQYKLCSWIKK